VYPFFSPMMHLVRYSLNVSDLISCTKVQSIISSAPFQSFAFIFTALCLSWTWTTIIDDVVSCCNSSVVLWWGLHILSDYEPVQSIRST